MKNLVRFAIALAIALALSFAPTANAGDIPIGGYCGSESCVMANPAPSGYYWNQEGDVWHMHRIN